MKYRDSDKDLYWKVLKHVSGLWAGGWGTTPDERSANINAARAKVDAMSPLELLEAISDVSETKA
jgi:hypothetical protein